MQINNVMTEKYGSQAPPQAMMSVAYSHRKVYKVLVSGNLFVDENLLVKGVYSKEIPTLRPVTDTIESIIETYVGIYGYNEVLVDRIKSCQLKMYKLSEI